MITSPGGRYCPGQGPGNSKEHPTVLPDTTSASPRYCINIHQIFPQIIKKKSVHRRKNGVQRKLYKKDLSNRIFRTTYSSWHKCKPFLSNSCVLLFFCFQNFPYPYKISSEDKPFCKQFVPNKFSQLPLPQSFLVFQLLYCAPTMFPVQPF